MGRWVSDKEYHEDSVIPPTHRLVPIEPTEEMITAGLIPTAAWQDIQGSALTVNREKMRLRYKAMVAAAPHPEKEKYEYPNGFAGLPEDQQPR